MGRADTSIKRTSSVILGDTAVREGDEEEDRGKVASGVDDRGAEPKVLDSSAEPGIGAVNESGCEGRI